MQAHDTQIPSFTPSAVQLPHAAGKPGALGSRRATACPAPGGPTPSTLSFCHPVIPPITVLSACRPPDRGARHLCAAHCSPQVIPGQHPHPACPANAPLLLQPHLQGPQSWSQPLVTAGRLPPLPSLAGMCHHHYSPACCQLDRFETSSPGHPVLSPSLTPDPRVPQGGCSSQVGTWRSHSGRGAWALPREGRSVNHGAAAWR